MILCGDSDESGSKQAASASSCMKMSPERKALGASSLLNWACWMVGWGIRWKKAEVTKSTTLSWPHEELTRDNLTCHSFRVIEKLARKEGVMVPLKVPT